MNDTSLQSTPTPSNQLAIQLTHRGPDIAPDLFQSSTLLTPIFSQKAFQEPIFRDALENLNNSLNNNSNTSVPFDRSISSEQQAKWARYVDTYQTPANQNTVVTPQLVQSTVVTPPQTSQDTVHTHLTEQCRRLNEQFGHHKASSNFNFIVLIGAAAGALISKLARKTTLAVFVGGFIGGLVTYLGLSLYNRVSNSKPKTLTPNTSI